MADGVTRDVERDEPVPPATAAASARAEADHGADADQAANPDLAAARLAKLGGAPLLPQAGASGAPLIAVLGAMCFLAAVTIASTLIVFKASDAWTADLSRSATVQIKGASNAELDAVARTLLQALAAAPEVARAVALDRAQTEALLEPWIGTANLPDDLPVPRLIEIDLAPGAPADLDRLRRRVAEAAPQATLDDHRKWNDQITRFSAMLKGAAYLALALITVTTVAIVIFAARADLAANAEIVEALHLMGAEDRFIASHVQRHFLKLAAIGAMAGGMAAIGALAGVYRLAQHWAGDDGFMPMVAFGAADLLWIALAPAALCAAAAVTARIAVLVRLGERL